MCELLRVAINLISFFQRHPGSSATAAGEGGRPKLTEGAGALEEEEELIVLENVCTASSADTFINAFFLVIFPIVPSNHARNRYIHFDIEAAIA